MPYVRKPLPPNPLMDKYRPPEAPPKPEKWKIPEIDYGLLGQFRSQQAKFHELEEINNLLSKPRRAYKIRMEDITEDDVDKSFTENIEHILHKIEGDDEEGSKSKRDPKLSSRLDDKLSVAHYERKLVGLSGGGATIPSARHFEQSGTGIMSGRKESSTQTLDQMMSARMNSARNGSGAGNTGGFGGTSARQMQTLSTIRESARGSKSMNMPLSMTKPSMPSIPPINKTRSAEEILRHTMADHGSGAVGDHMISALKTLGPKHPEVLAKWRSDRASEFVVDQKHPLDPPTHRDMTDRVFRPAGSYTRQPPKALPGRRGGGGGGTGATKTVKKNSQQPLQPGEEENTARMKETLDTLMEQLTKTEHEIERQKLKIALKRKNKHYETQTGAV